MKFQEEIKVSKENQQLITVDQAWHYQIIPIKSDLSQFSFYISSRQNPELIRPELEMIFGKQIELKIKDPEIVTQALSIYYRKVNNNELTDKTINRETDFLSSIISEAKNLGSSDIHLEAYEDKCRVRLRIDGHLLERYVISKNEYPSLINKIKIKANLDIAEKRLPQDGRIFYSNNNQKFDIRVSALPTLHGEKIVMRLLNKDATNIEIETLGFTAAELNNYLEGIKKPHGILLISGPTGSGKTTTLYATLKLLNKEKTNILTVEDPIEYTLPGINQVQLKENIGLTFPSALKTFLRQDPDVIMVGEIRDGETAQIAIRAALTGHLVLSTIHTNSAWGIMSRLVDMGVPSYLLSGTLNTLVAQRLLRLLCKRCKQETALTRQASIEKFKKPISKHFIAKGCEECYYTGYKGRRAIYEILPLDEEFSELIKLNKQDIGEVLKRKNIKTLSENAFDLFYEGHTTLEEIYPIIVSNQ